MATRTGPRTSKRKSAKKPPPKPRAKKAAKPAPLIVPMEIVHVPSAKNPPSRVARALQLLSENSSYQAARKLRDELGIGIRASALAVAKASAIILPNSPEAKERFRASFVARLDKIAEQAAAVGDYRAAISALVAGARLLGFEQSFRDQNRFGSSKRSIIDITALGNQVKGQDLTKPLSESEMAELVQIGREIGAAEAAVEAE